jgi:hypothetical protein
MNLAASDTEETSDPESSQPDAFAALIGLARMSRLNLLYYRSDQAGAGGEALLQAARRRGGNEIALLFHEWDDAPLPMLQQRLDEAIHHADPGAAPYFGDLPSALAHWQHEQGLRFFLILDAFDRHLARHADTPEVAEFDRALIRLASDPMLELHILLCMDENAAPTLDRLRPFLADLGQEYLRMPELPGAAPRPKRTAPQESPEMLTPPEFRPEWKEMPPNGPEEPTMPRTGPWNSASAPQPAGRPEPRTPAPPDISAPAEHAEPLLPILPPGDESPVVGQTETADHRAFGATPSAAEMPPAVQVERRDASTDRRSDAGDSTRGPDRRRRDFPALIESLPHELPDAPAHAGATARLKSPGGVDAPLRVYPWLHDRLRHRRLITLRLATTGMLASTVVCFVMLAAMALLLEMPKFGKPPAETAHIATPPAQAAPVAKTLSITDVAKALGLRLPQNRGSESDEQ